MGYKTPKYSSQLSMIPSPIRVLLVDRSLLLLFPTRIHSSATTSQTRMYSTPSRQSFHCLFSSLFNHKTLGNLLIIPLLQRIPCQAAKHQPRNRRPNATFPIPLSRLLRDDSSSHSANHAGPNTTVRGREMLLCFIEPVCGL